MENCVRYKKWLQHCNGQYALVMRRKHSVVSWYEVKQIADMSLDFRNLKYTQGNGETSLVSITEWNLHCKVLQISQRSVNKQSQQWQFDIIDILYKNDILLTHSCFRQIA